MHCLYSILLDQHTTFYLSTYCWGSILLSHLKQFVDIMTFYHEKVWCVFFKDKDILVFSLWHSGLKIWCCLWHRLQLLLGFDPWPRNFYMCHTDTQTDTQTQTHTDTQTHRHTHTHTHTRIRTFLLQNPNNIITSKILNIGSSRRGAVVNESD